MAIYYETFSAELPVAPEQLPDWSGVSGSAVVVFLLGLAVAYGLGKIALLLLRARQFDRWFTPPWKPAFNKQESERWSASVVVGWCVSATAIILLIWGYTQYHRVNHPFVEQMLYLCGQAWLLLITILVALGISKIVAGAVLSIFNNQTVRKQLELFCPHTDTENETDLESSTEQQNQDQTAAENEKSEKTEAFADTIARLVGLLIYLIVFLPLFMVAAEIWSWSDTSNAISSIWGWLIPLVGLAALILLGWFALTAAVIAVIPASQRRSVMIGTTVLALIILVASYNTIFALIFSVAIIIFAWSTRNDLPDALAGWYLKAQTNLTAKTPLGAGKVVRVQLLTSDINTVNGSFRVRNRHVLRCYLDGTMIAQDRMIPIDDSGNPIMPDKQDSDESICSTPR